GSDKALSFARDEFDKMTAGHDVHPDIAKAALQSGAFSGGPEELEWLKTRFEKSPNEHERLNILLALGAFRHWELCEQALAFVFEKVPARNKFIPIVACALNPAHQDHLWQWYQSRLGAL
ncbi:MAG: hypothetical protein GY874_17075, partial [Desulfobacteraceae bacterium]|nr:hypothetical protein [Desulfobacteraceae bacterium]